MRHPIPALFVSALFIAACGGSDDSAPDPLGREPQLGQEFVLDYGDSVRVEELILKFTALGDIGRHFPDNDPRYRGADSRALLREVAKLLHDNHYQVLNVDSTIVAQAPRMAPHVPAMIANNVL